MTTLTVNPLFSYPVSESILENVNSKEVLLQLQKEEYKLTYYSKDIEDNTNIHQSKSIEILEKYPSLKKSIEETLKIYVNDVLKYSKIKYKIVSSWATMTPPGGIAQRHKHSNSWISGVYYPKESSAKLRFYNSKSQFIFDDPYEYNILNANTWDVSPKENMLVIFDSSLEHSVLKNLSQETRYSIAFNVFPYGIIGYGDSTLVIPSL